MIGIKEYNRLCNLSKNILKQRISLSNLANPFLFLVSGHPFFLSKYKQINSKNITFSFLIKFFCEVFLNIIKLFLFIFKLLLTKNFYKTENKKNKFLILSHLQNKYNFQNNIDIQYGGIEKKFPRKKTIFFYLSHIKLNENDKNNSIKIRKNYFINNDCISIYKYITIISKILKEFCFFYKKIKKTKNNFDKKFYILCVKHLLSLSTVKNLILFYNLEKLILDNKIKFILTTFEGHPYEYLVFLLGKKYSIKIFSYQHSFITSSNFSMFLNLRKDIAPNKILITGKVNYDFLKKKLNSKKIILLGSSKYKKFNLTNKKGNLNCLLIPSAFEKEPVEFLKLCYNCLKKNKNLKINFILRLHPQINKSKFEQDNRELLKINKIQISNTKLKNDISSCKFVIYRDSSAVIEAIQQGLVPIHFYDKSTKFQLDPLWQLKSKITIKNSNQLLLFFKKNNLYSKSHISSYIKFANEFYKPIDIKKLIKLIK